MDENILVFDKKFLYDFWRLLQPYWSSKEKWLGFGFLLLVVGCIIGEVRLSVALNNFNKEFFDALQHKDKLGILHSLFNFSIIIVCSAFAFSYSLYFNRCLGIRWRRWLTEKYLKKWLINHNHYHMQHTKNFVDNPDQRISEDIEKFVLSTISLFALMVHTSLTLVSFGYILWNLGGGLEIAIYNIYFTIPHYLFFAAVLYALVGSYITNRIGKTLASCEYQLQKINADFRFRLVRLREASEQVAFYRGENTELNLFNKILGHVFNNYTTIISIKRNLSLFSSSYRHAVSIYGFLLTIPLYLAKKIQLGGVMQISNALEVTINSFSVFIASFPMLTDWRATIARLSEYNNLLATIPEQTRQKIDILESANNDIRIADLELKLPNGDILFKKLNFKLPRGKKIFIGGASGTGKTTLLRAIAGIWPYGNGQIYLPENAAIMILPQKPYLPVGTLKEALCYPHNNNINNNILIELMKTCGLNQFINQLDAKKNWTLSLSIGEQQLLGLIRALLKEPDFLFLDEATSALDEFSQLLFYNKLFKCLPHTTIITIGHNNNLKPLHNLIINIDAEKKIDAVDLSKLNLLAETHME